MLYLLSCVFILLLAGLSQQKDLNNHNLQLTSVNSSSSCPTWTYEDNGTCTCGTSLYNTVYCHREGETPEDIRYDVSILYGLCMTLDKESINTVAGLCPYNNPRPLMNSSLFFMLYIPIPQDVTKLNHAVCGYTNRSGQLCGKCVDGYSPPVYSYYSQCVRCSAGTNNWAMYLAVSLLPTTAFFIGALVFRFRATSPLLNGYIFLCQIVTLPIALRRYYNDNRYSNTIGVNVYVALLSIWNLDFFRMLYSPFCLHPHSTTLQALSLDYITAAYPLVLIILTYALVKLHYHNYTLVVWLCRPIINCFARFRRQWDIENSLVDAFATFFLLSYVKFLSVSIDILTPASIWNVHNQQTEIVLFYDGTIRFFKGEHIPYAILAISVMCVFSFLPIMLLCVYPCRCFQKCLNKYRLNNQALHTFMDTLQGSFKNGTNGAKDCRYFSAVYLMARVGVNVIWGFSIQSLVLMQLISLLLFVLLLLSCGHPYKKMFYNKLDVFFLLCLSYILTYDLYINDYEPRYNSTVGTVVSILIFLIPLVYPFSVLVYHLWNKSGRFRDIIKCTKTILSQCCNRQQSQASLQDQGTMNEASPLLPP